MSTAMRARLGINNCFAVKRWPQPDDRASIVANDLGLDTVELSLDLLAGLSVPDAAHPGTRAQRWADLRDHLAELAAYAHGCGLDHLLVDGSRSVTRFSTSR